MRLEKIKKSLHQYMIDQKIYGNYRYGGSGSNGHIFFLNDVVIKITKDKKELETSQFFQFNPHPCVVTYYDTKWEDNLGYIKMEYVTPLDIVENNLLIKDWHEIINPDTDKVFGYGIDEHRMDILKLRSDFDIDVRELHWGNCGFNVEGKLKFFDLKLS